MFFCAVRTLQFWLFRIPCMLNGIQCLQLRYVFCVCDVNMLLFVFLFFKHISTWTCFQNASILLWFGIVRNRLISFFRIPCMVNGIQSLQLRFVLCVCFIHMLLFVFLFFGNMLREVLHSHTQVASFNAYVQSLIQKRRARLARNICMGRRVACASLARALRKPCASILMSWNSYFRMLWWK